MKQEKIAVVGLGYVGLPLAVAFAGKFEVVGYDRSRDRIAELKDGMDHTGEVRDEVLAASSISFTDDPEDLRSATFIIVAVPTPINKAREPDLRPLEGASNTVGKILQRGMMVVYESTVYPGVTEDVCLPILEKESGLKLGDFDLGYSPERINPGDEEHRVVDIVKVVSGHTPESLDRCAEVYGSIIKAGVHRATNIKTAESSKVIENVQRDLNIALMNELSKIFARIGVDTREVIEASATKWNFHRYTPGLVGGHCIGVDPYYLTHLALQVGYHPEVILSGRRINDSMGSYVGDRVVRGISSAGAPLKGAKVWLLGMTFKENVPDFRNTKAVDVAEYLKEFGADVRVWEPMVSKEKIEKTFGYASLTYEEADQLDAVILINGHDVLKAIDLKVLREKMRSPVLVDVKGFFSKEEAARLGFDYSSL